MSRKVFIAVVILSSFAFSTNGQLLGDDLPVEINECIQTLIERENHAGPSYTTLAMESFQTICMQRFYWKFGGIQWSKFNITEDQKKFVNSLIGSVYERVRYKRQGDQLSMAERGTRPKTGFRIRKEYRRLTDGERAVFHETLRKMKASGQYDTFANFHTGVVISSAHQGPNFPSWHRIYLSLFEEAMRQISPSISLPYWDSTLDFDMPNPVDSIIWSASFLGNGNGLVTSGPFANWMTNALELRRNIGGDSTLFTKEVVDRILTKCRNSEILYPTAESAFDLDTYHGGPHVWVGGQFAFGPFAAHDPVFFLHHAYVDYIWERFRAHQKNFCRVNPESDYPDTSNEFHTSNRSMDYFPQYRHIDGYRNYWTQHWYRYEPSPTCTSYQQSCNTPYLRCNSQTNRCVSVERSGITPAGSSYRYSDLAADVISSGQQARAQEALISAGPKFRAPPAEVRTQAAQMALAASTTSRRRKRAVNTALQDKLWNEFPKGKKFRAPPAEPRTAEALGIPFVPSSIKNDTIVDPKVANGQAFPRSKPRSLLSLPPLFEPSYKPPIDGVALSEWWRYIDTQPPTKENTNWYWNSYNPNRQYRNY